ncbi:MAG: ArsA family ATPase [Xenococcaceae cyanobacterium]
MILFDRLKLAMFSGKGGVGKSTISSGFACRWAKQFPQEKILLVSTDPAHSLGDILQLEVSDRAINLDSISNLYVRNLDAERLLKDFKERYGNTLELLVERGSFVEGEDLTPVWDLDWPGLDELMGLLEIQRLFSNNEYDRVVVDMAPSGHTLNFFELMDFLDEMLETLELFQEKHRYMSLTFSGKYTPDEADDFLKTFQEELSAGRKLLQGNESTACLVVAIAEPMSFLETRRFIEGLEKLQIPCGGIFLNQIVADTQDIDRALEQQEVVCKFTNLAGDRPLWLLFEQQQELLGESAVSDLLEKIRSPEDYPIDSSLAKNISFPERIEPTLPDFISLGRRLILVGGKGGVGKTTISATIAYGMAEKYPDKNIRIISIDPAHSLGDALGMTLGHEPQSIKHNLQAQEVDAKEILEQFREEYLWELAAMMSGDNPDNDSGIAIAYGPKAWRNIVEQALPGVDEMLSLLNAIALLEDEKEDLIIIDTAPTGHLLRFLEMPTALADWLAWIFKLWMKYQKVLGRTEFMGRLRKLRQKVVKAQKIFKDPAQTEFLGVTLARSGVVAETKRLYTAMEEKGIAQNYVVLNRFTGEKDISNEEFPGVEIIRLPMLPRSVKPIARIEGAANCLFELKQLAMK